jgi:hypothetical protein
MARIRTIKPEFFRHELLQDLEREHGDLKPMLVFAGLWTVADKNGVFEWRPRQLKLDILPFIDFKMDETLSLLKTNNLISSFIVLGKTYGFILSFHEHQRITGKEATSPGRYPEPIFETTGKQQGSTQETTGKQQGEQEKEKEKEKEQGKGYGENQEAFSETQKQEPDALLSELREVMDDISQRISNPHKQRKIMLFIESNIKHKNHGAMIKCLKSLQMQLRKGDKIEAPMEYLEAALRIEDGKFNALENELRSEEFKKPVPDAGREALRKIMEMV